MIPPLNSQVTVSIIQRSCGRKIILKKEYNLFQLIYAEAALNNNYSIITTIQHT